MQSLRNFTTIVFRLPEIELNDDTIHSSQENDKWRVTPKELTGYALLHSAHLTYHFRKLPTNNKIRVIALSYFNRTDHSYRSTKQSLFPYRSGLRWEIFGCKVQYQTFECLYLFRCWWMKVKGDYDRKCDISREAWIRQFKFKLFSNWNCQKDVVTYTRTDIYIGKFLKADENEKLNQLTVEINRRRLR